MQAATEVGQLTLPPGSYVISGTAILENGNPDPSTFCGLSAGTLLRDVDAGSGQVFKPILQFAATFSDTQVVTMNCDEEGSSNDALTTASWRHLTAIKVGALH